MPTEIQPDAKIEKDSSTSQDANREASSTSTGDKPAGTMLDTLKETWKRSTSQAAADEPADEGSDSTVEQDAEDKDKTEEEPKGDKPEGEADDEAGSEDEVQEEEDKDKGKKPESEEKTQKQKDEDARLDKQPRFQELNQRVKAMEPDANLGKAVKNYLGQHRIPQQTYEQGLELMRLLVEDPAKALLAMKPIYESLQKHAGDILDDDLRAAVEGSEMNEARAKEFQRMRNQQAMGTRMTEQQQIEQRQRAYDDSMNGWVQDKMRTDPDYKPSATPDQKGLFETTEAFFARNAASTPPRNPQEAVALAEKSYKEAKQMFAKRLTPQPKKKKVLRSNGSGGGEKSVKPGSLAEVLKATYDRHSAD